MGFWSGLKAIVVSVAAFLGLTSNEACFGGLGCFSNKAPFDNAGGYLPQAPADIKVEFLLYTPQNRAVPQVISADAAVLRACHLSSIRKSVFIIHGYRDNPYASWVTDMKDALLSQTDVNVVSVDWGRGADKSDYDQAAANTRVVGALIAQLLTALRDFRSLNYKDVHLVGHSLGLDPAGLSFEADPEEVRLDPGDALFVDVIHTDAQPLISLGRVWLIYKCKFCCMRGFREGIACDHSRAQDYFTESITSTCRFTASWCLNYDAFKRGDCPCGKSPCVSMGFYARANATRGKYFLDTADKSPFCLTRNSL
ncbi:LIPR2-like protein [Mya arenaria]|uniref:LIPR2-like protein n=1 Tax=Mya arenaria TaxID=6604 RepID=A0ABY7FKU5_MYAAR|nr:LIPR2-like protein [Mya arenaria]